MRRLKTGRRPPIYPKTPGHLPCSSLTHPLPLPSRRPSVSFGGFGFRLGDPSPVVQAVLDVAPTAGDAVSGAITLNSGIEATNELGYYHYNGSMTTPPCEERVGWYVMRELKTVSPEQVDNLLALSGGPNNRPVQPTGNRVILIGGAP